MSSVTQTTYMTKMIREGFEKADVDLWQALCQQCKTDIGNSHEYMFILLDMARHNDCGVLDVVKTGRVSCKERVINAAFMASLHSCMASDDEVEIGKSSAGVLDLTCEESGSYEETDEKYLDAPTSAEAYEIDGFVVPDHHSEGADDDVDDKPRKLKRRLATITEDEE